ncbi:hypothetical protein [Paenibacillus sp. L3-i20]|uniref:hypothetical protein n=1 Tax=Paenibacillus sp. L3-i20 TaxID=2905833 RepID=UPI0020C06C8F|nr:hypothetical protein [Paenibacillus sp. L3-i20]
MMEFLSTHINETVSGYGVKQVQTVQCGGTTVTSPYNWTKLRQDTSPSTTSFAEAKTIDIPHPYGNSQSYGYYIITYYNVWSNWMSGNTINFSLTTNSPGTVNGFVELYLNS